MQEVTAYLKDRQEKDQDFDRAFLQVLPYMQADWRGLSLNKIFQMEMEYKGWDEKKFMLVYRLAERMKIGVQTQLETTFDGEIAKSPLLTSQVASRVFSLFQISLENYFKTKFYLGIHLRMQPSDDRKYVLLRVLLLCKESVGIHQS